MKMLIFFDWLQSQRRKCPKLFWPSPQKSWGLASQVLRHSLSRLPKLQTKISKIPTYFVKFCANALNLAFNDSHNLWNARLLKTIKCSFLGWLFDNEQVFCKTKSFLLTGQLIFSRQKNAGFLAYPSLNV